mmetsp:Transcript_61710/g.139043  ORF Transcript_61710/g.139043 Transcript_61710/m.139043 type:complete len:215 (+) Transcript_61710:156-800(+)
MSCSKGLSLPAVVVNSSPLTARQGGDFMGAPDCSFMCARVSTGGRCSRPRMGSAVANFGPGCTSIRDASTSISNGFANGFGPSPGKQASVGAVEACGEAAMVTAGTFSKASRKASAVLPRAPKASSTRCDLRRRHAFRPSLARICRTFVVCVTLCSLSRFRASLASAFSDSFMVLSQLSVSSCMPSSFSLYRLSSAAALSALATSSAQAVSVVL